MILRHLRGARASKQFGFSQSVIVLPLKATAKISSVAKVKVRQGTVVGGENALPNGSSYHYFKGIPYAVPPLRELRFKAPIPLESFPKSKINCLREGRMSFQKNPLTGQLVGSEDCLFLNVHTPKLKSNELLPVMVFIHGGGYMFGNPNSDHHTPLYLMQEGTVVVTVNYRLGVAGFLALPEANAPGNFALKDQRLALEWVRENISQFNGDPNNVTLFGESAGAACVQLHVYSDSSKKLFHKAIMQSGLANMPWAMQENASYKATKLAQLMGCISEDPLEVIRFLRYHKNITDFSKYIQMVLTSDESRRGLPMPVRPVVEQKSQEAVVTKEPLESMNTPNFLNIPVIMGYNSAEGIVRLAHAIKKLEDFDGDLGRVIPRNIKLHPDDPESFKLAQRIRSFYFKGEKLKEDNFNSFSNLFTDFHFVIDGYKAAEIHARKQHNSPLFFYRFDYVGGLNIFKKLFQLEYLKGACHADELFYLFQSNWAKEPWSDRDKKMVLTLCKLWANFAKYGNPTPQCGEEFVDCAWEPVRKINRDDKFNLNAFIIDEKQKMLKNPDIERIDFWRSVYREYNGEF